MNVILAKYTNVLCVIPMDLIDRTIEPIAKSLARQYPVLTITGPRQSGKTTLCKKIFSDKPYVNLEFPDTRQFAIDDPRSFLAQFPDGAVLDHKSYIEFRLLG